MSTVELTKNANGFHVKWSGELPTHWIRIHFPTGDLWAKWSVRGHTIIDKNLVRIDVHSSGVFEYTESEFKTYKEVLDSAK